MKRLFPILIALSIAAAGPGCAPKRGPAATPSPAAAKPSVTESHGGPVSVRLTLDPPVVRMDRDTMLTLQIAAPAGVEFKMPALEGRTTGFLVSGVFDRPPETRDGKVVRERCARLTPLLSAEYRIAPMAVRYRANEHEPERWFPTKPVRIDTEPLVKGETPADLAGPAKPVWIYPGFKTVALWILGAIAAAGIGYLLWILFRRVRREVRLRRMSPRERALHELAELLARDLIAKDRVQDFYFELTMIVRAYIERAHTIRAPEQTTEEFLQAVSHDTRFSRDVVNRLRSFLQAADLVKYAAQTPEPEAVDKAVATARTYIVTDAEDAAERNMPQGNPI